MKDKKTSVIYGLLLNSKGQPISEAKISFIDGPVSLPDIALLTGKSGQFILMAPAEGTYKIGCHADGYEPAISKVNIKSGLDVNVEITLKRINF